MFSIYDIPTLCAVLIGCTKKVKPYLLAKKIKNIFKIKEKISKPEAAGNEKQQILGIAALWNQER